MENYIGIKTKIFEETKFVLLSEKDSLNYDVYIDKGKFFYFQNCNILM